MENAIPSVTANPLRIGNDVWIGANVIITPSCKSIGDGAIVGAGSVVTRDVPPFTIVAGNPAKIIAKRFTAELEEIISESRWWDNDMEYIAYHMECFTQELTPLLTERFKRAFSACPSTCPSK